MRMTDARLDRTAYAWHDEFCRWSWRRQGRNVEIVRVGKVALGLIDEVVMHTLRGRKNDPERFDAEAWLNTYRNRASARAALSAADGAK